MLRHKASRGEAVSRAPRGLRIVDKRFEPDRESEGLRVAARARELREGGLTLREIANRLHREGFTPERAEKFSTAGLWYILRNARLLSHAAT